MDALKIVPSRPQSNDEQDLVSTLIQDYEYLYGLRGNWNSHWTEIAERIYPMHSWLFQNYSQLTVKGDKRNFEIYDSTGVLALNYFGAILDSLLTPRDQFWQQLRPSDDRLMKDKATRDWFDHATQILFKQRYTARANFAAQNQLQYRSLGAYGTGVMFIDRLAGTPGLRYRNVHLGEVYLQENHQGVVDRVCRKFILTARQAYQKFGDRCPGLITSVVNTAPEREFFFLHWCMPRKDRDPFRKDFKGMEYASYYVSLEGRELVEEGGYRTFPYAISRYEQAPNEAYGRSPAMDVLPAIKTLNEEKKAILKAGHRALDPVLLAHDDGVVDAFDFEPGSMNFGGVSKDGRPLIHALPVGDIHAGKEIMDDERKLINDSFLVNLFQILTENPEMTATEVMERTREKGILLAPSLGRQQSEYLGPLTDRELDLLQLQGLLPPMPPLLRQAKGDYKIVWESPISRTQKAEWASGALRTIEALMNVANTIQDPSILDYIDWDMAAPAIAEIYGTPLSWLRTVDNIKAIRQQRAKQQALQAAIQAAPAVAGMQKAQAAGGGGKGAPTPTAPGMAG